MIHFCGRLCPKLHSIAYLLYLPRLLNDDAKIKFENRKVGSVLYIRILLINKGTNKKLIWDT